MGFDDVVPDSQMAYDCSPPAETDDLEWSGIRITAPREVELVVESGEDGEDASIAKTRLILCLLLQFSSARLLAHDEPASAISVVAVDKETGEAYSGDLTSQRSRRPVPRSTLPQAELEESVSLFYYNVNLTQYLDLPAAPATYLIYASFEDCRSDMVEVVLA